jgi:hypothetical protein
MEDATFDERREMERVVVREWKILKGIAIVY